MSAVVVTRQYRNKHLALENNNGTDEFIERLPESEEREMDIVLGKLLLG